MQNEDSQISKGRVGTITRLSVACVALVGGGTIIGLSGSGVASASPKVHWVTFWNAYNDVTETPVMNGVVIPAFESANPGIKVKDDTLPYAGMLQKFIASSARAIHRT